ncbi:hypothetical protein SAMN06297144_1184 [Sphingomonas guangdongensis]|uniref:Uncharacterized protein n=1 Tax=Sphingomonas guangdongensis TaxID=1141890 RepID=A0A285QGP5_9SPHN|nr:hypothetical protein [Sphingomonas guangdongensis]SOB80678.1 hypothetical protein SAMN06297144_1184 [Sphingomonas guangdongensis]
MPADKTSKPSSALIPSKPVERQFGGELVRVEAVFRNPEIRHPSGGAWALEADKIAWTDPMSGYACIILRDAKGMHLRGFVAVPPGHPFYGRQVGTLVGYEIGVHGGLDYSSECQHRQPEYRSVCHVRIKQRQPRQIHANAAAKAHDDAWWLGFSCNHPGDAWPNISGRLVTNEPLAGLNEATYKDERYVYGECVRLALQLKAVELGSHPSDADPGPTARAYDPNDYGER